MPRVPGPLVSTNHVSSFHPHHNFSAAGTIFITHFTYEVKYLPEASQLLHSRSGSSLSHCSHTLHLPLTKVT